MINKKELYFYRTKGYLTPNWKKKWGGNLELGTSNKKKKVTEIEPFEFGIAIEESMLKSLSQLRLVLSEI